MTGWVNADGSAVTGATIASTNDQLTAVWDTVNPLVPETDGEGTVLSDKAQKYDAYLLDADGAMVGTVHVSVGKRNKKTGLATVKATLKLVGSNKAYAFKAKEAKGGKATLSPDGMTKGVELANSKLGTMTIDIGTEGVCGAWNGYEINGVRDVSKAEKALYASWACVKTVAIADASGAYSTFSVKIGKSGSVNVRGYMSDGTSLSVSTRLMVADDGSEACVAVKGTKKAPVGFTLWLKHDDKGNVVAEGVESETGDALSGNAKTGDLGIGASSLTLKIGGVAVDVDYDGKSLKAAKDSGVTIRYTKSTGAFSGSRKVNTANAKGRAKKKTVSFKGVFVDGVGYGVTTTKGYAGVPVVIEAK